MSVSVRGAGIGIFCSRRVTGLSFPEADNLAHRKAADMRALGMELLLDQSGRTYRSGDAPGGRDTGRLLGGQMIGHYGTEVSKRVDIFATAIHHGMSVEYLNDLDMSYTPPLSSPWDPVQMAAQAWVASWRAEVGRSRAA